MTDKIIILSTCGSEEEAEKLGRLLVDQQLAGCVNVIPQVRSYYRWKGAVESAEECLLIIKSSRGLFDAVRTVLETAHSYEVPEVLAIPLLTGAETYLNWLASTLRAHEEE